MEKTTEQKEHRINVYCLRCEADLKGIKTVVPHNIMCNHATREEIEKAGNLHMDNFYRIWVATKRQLEKEGK